MPGKMILKNITLFTLCVAMSYHFVALRTQSVY